LEFERQFGQVHPTVQPSFNQALAKAKSEFRFLLAYIHSPSHVDTEDFCKTVLCTEVITEFINANFLFWMGSVTLSEGFKVSAELGATTFPFLAVICYNVKGEPTLVDTIEGTLGLHELLSQLTVVVEQHGPSLQGVRNQRQQQERDRSLIQEQDQAYQELLRQDQEREQRERQERLDREKKETEEQDRLKQAEEEERRKTETKIKRRQQLKSSLPMEPAQNEQGVTSLVFRLTDGSRLQRRFKSNERLQSVYDYLEAQENVELPSHFVLVTNFPRKSFADKNVTLLEAGLVPQSALFIEDLEKAVEKSD